MRICGAKRSRSAGYRGLASLAICGGYQMLGQYYKIGRCAVRFYRRGVSTSIIIGSKDRMIGNYMFTCDELNCVNDRRL